MNSRTMWRALRNVEAPLTAIFAQPLIPLQIAALGLVAGGMLGAPLGAADLFWSESFWAQFANGIGCSLLFGHLLLIRYLLDPARREPAREPGLEPFWVRLVLFRFTPFFGWSPAVGRFVRFLACVWIPLLVSLLALGFSRGLRPPPLWGAPLACGLIVGVGLAAVAVRVARRVGFFDQRLRDDPVPVGESDSPLSVWLEQQPLRKLFTLSAWASVVAVAISYVIYAFGGGLPPVAVACALLAMINSVYSFVALHRPGLQYVLLVLAASGVLVANSPSVFPDSAYRYPFPGLEPYYSAPLELDRARGWDGADLIPSESLLRISAERWQAAGNRGKPRLVIVCASGGGIRSAVWTLVVLEELERAMPSNFRQQIRLVTGSGGGMVGAGLYVANFEEGSGTRVFDSVTGLGDLSDALAGDCLSRPAQTLLLRDLPLITFPVRSSWDRGRELERAWDRLTVERLRQVPLRRSFRDLSEAERVGQRPSLVFSPLMVEDGRRLLISNLDLSDLTHGSEGPPFRDRPELPDGANPRAAPSALELFRLFPDAHKHVTVGTAARVSATFPLLSPAVSLPTNPPRRVVSPGSFDTFDVHLVARWLRRHERAVREYTSGVLVIEIRPSESGERGGPLDTLLPAAFARSAPHDSAGILSDLEQYYSRSDRPFDRPDRPFLKAVTFRGADTSPSWILPREEARRIGTAFTDDAEMQGRVYELRKWFGPARD